MTTKDRLIGELKGLDCVKSVRDNYVPIFAKLHNGYGISILPQMVGLRTIEDVFEVAVFHPSGGMIQGFFGNDLFDTVRRNLPVQDVLDITVEVGAKECAE